MISLQDTINHLVNCYENSYLTIKPVQWRFQKYIKCEKHKVLI